MFQCDSPEAALESEPYDGTTGYSDSEWPADDLDPASTEPEGADVVDAQMPISNNITGKTQAT